MQSVEVVRAASGGKYHISKMKKKKDGKSEEDEEEECRGGPHWMREREDSGRENVSALRTAQHSESAINQSKSSS
jgi:hypothetical protein